MNLEETETIDRCNLCSSNRFETIDSVAQLQRCMACGFVFVNPRPIQRAIIEYYCDNQKYSDWLLEQEARDLLWLRRIQKMEKTKKQGTLLDVGTGIGQFLYHAKNFYSDVWGTEISVSGAEIARSKYGFNVLIGDLSTLPTTRLFDNITLFHVLEHLPDPRGTLEKCWSLLNPHGVIVIAVPNDLLAIKGKIRHKIQHMKQPYRATTGPTGLPQLVLDGTLAEIHLSQFTPTTLTKMLHATGFSVVHRSLDPFFAAKGKKLILHKLYYALHLFIHRVAGFNWYESIWMVGRKS